MSFTVVVQETALRALARIRAEGRGQGSLRLDQASAGGAGGTAAF
jgi:hypothetical protein